MNFNTTKDYTIDELVGKGTIPLSNRIRLRKAAAEAFEEMVAVALKEGIEIVPVSAFRSYEKQEQIWTNKYKRFIAQGLMPIKAIRKIIEYSTIPGTSRHHWGTEVDVIQGGKPKQQDSLLARHFEANGVFRELKIWLDENKTKFDFYEVYTNDPKRRGFKYEPWHLSYRPIAYEMLQAYKEIDLKEFIQQVKLVGREHFSDEFINQYRKENILDINPKLL